MAWVDAIFRRRVGGEGAVGQARAEVVDFVGERLFAGVVRDVRGVDVRQLGRMSKKLARRPDDRELHRRYNRTLYFWRAGEWKGTCRPGWLTVHLWHVPRRGTLVAVAMRRIYEIDPAGGELRTLVRADGEMYAFGAMSPGRGHLAVIGAEMTGSQVLTLVEMADLRQRRVSVEESLRGVRWKDEETLLAWTQRQWFRLDAGAEGLEPMGALPGEDAGISAVLDGEPVFVASEAIEPGAIRSTVLWRGRSVELPTRGGAELFVGDGRLWAVGSIGEDGGILLEVDMPGNAVRQVSVPGDLVRAGAWKGGLWAQTEAGGLFVAGPDGWGWERICDLREEYGLDGA